MKVLSSFRANTSIFINRLFSVLCSRFHGRRMRKGWKEGTLDFCPIPLLSDLWQDSWERTRTGPTFVPFLRPRFPEIMTRVDNPDYYHPIRRYFPDSTAVAARVRLFGGDGGGGSIKNQQSEHLTASSGLSRPRRRRRDVDIQAEWLSERILNHNEG